jgi:hypothetical protein
MENAIMAGVRTKQTFANVQFHSTDFMLRTIDRS